MGEVVTYVMRVSAVLTDLNLLHNEIGPKGATAIAKALEVNGVLTSCDLEGNHIEVEGAEALASALEVNAVLTSLNLADNNLISSFDCEDEVEGDTYTAGAKVLFKGVEYIVISAETGEQYPTLGVFSGINSIAKALQ